MSHIHALRRIQLLKLVLARLRHYDVDRDLMTRVTEERFEGIVNEVADRVEEEFADKRTIPSGSEYVDRVAQGVQVALVKRYHEDGPDRG